MINKKFMAILQKDSAAWPEIRSVRNANKTAFVWCFGADGKARSNEDYYLQYHGR
jgi:hypothetical protein